jgi:excisionase family DNA binding protein
LINIKYNIVLYGIIDKHETMEEVMENDLVLTTEEAAEFLKLTPFTVRDYARRRILPARKVGKGWRFYKPDLVAWLRDYKAPIGTG